MSWWRKGDKVVQLQAHTNMTPEEALAFCSRERWSEILIIGADENGEFTQRSSGMSKRDALWLLEWAKRRIYED